MLTFGLFIGGGRSECRTFIGTHSNWSRWSAYPSRLYCWLWNSSHPTTLLYIWWSLWVSFIFFYCTYILWDLSKILITVDFYEIGILPLNLDGAFDDLDGVLHFSSSSLVWDWINGVKVGYYKPIVFISCYVHYNTRISSKLEISRTCLFPNARKTG